MSILRKHRNDIDNDLNFVNAIYEICLPIDHFRVTLTEIFASSKLIHLLIQILNKNAAFNLSKYATVVITFFLILD